MRKLITSFSLVTSVAVLALVSLCMPLAHAFNQNLLIDDVVFNDSGSMSAASIDNWLNVNFPQSCISTNSSFQARVPSGYTPSGGFTYGGFGSAGQVISTAAQVYGINPQVLMVTLQKEQSLIAGGSSYCNDGDEHKYAAAMGYGCPDSGTVHSYTGVSLYMRNGVEHTSTGSTCVNSAAAAGFSQQTIRAAWLLKFGQQRSLGNTGWAVVSGSWDNSDDPPTCYGGPMNQGTLSRGCGQPAVPYDGYTTIDGATVHIDSGGTAALYWYTPHFHGNQVFYDNFTAWFGSTISAGYYSCHGASNVGGLGPGERIIKNRTSGSGSDKLSLTILNQTGSSCVEVHTWADGSYQGWIQHTATNMGAVEPHYSDVISAKRNGLSTSSLYLVNYTLTGSGMIEFHGWDTSNQKWTSHVATNRPAIDPADAKVVAADTNGDGQDEFYLVQYRNTGSGMIEVHGWSPNLQQWTSHVATNRPAIDPADGEVITSDPNGDGQDEFYLVQYRNTGSGMIEVHGWSPNLQQWTSHVATNRPAIDPGEKMNPNARVVSADTNGDGRDELLLVQYRGTGSGRVEVHGWTSDLHQWTSHIVTSQGAF